MAKTLAIIFGVVFVLVGILGYFQNPIVGMNGLFLTNHAHDIAHIVLGVILLIAAFASAARAGLWMLIVGIVYLILALLGFIMAPNGGMVIGLDINSADNWLHVVFAVVLIAAGLMTKGKKASMSSAPATPAGPSM